MLFLTCRSAEPKNFPYPSLIGPTTGTSAEPTVASKHPSATLSKAASANPLFLPIYTIDDALQTFGLSISNKLCVNQGITMHYPVKDPLSRDR